MKTCSKCGANAGDYDKFCTKCGSNFYIECPKCGKELDKSAEYCPSCGAKCKVDDDFDDEPLPQKILSVAGQNGSSSAAPNSRNSFYGGADLRLSRIKIISDKPIDIE